MPLPRIIPFTEDHLPLLYAWAKKEHVKNTWFLEGYMTVDEIAALVHPNGYDTLCLITWEDRPIGLVLYTDIEAYGQLSPNPSDLPEGNLEGAFGFDLFIGEEACLNKGIGTQAVRLLVSRLFSKYHASRILVDPSAENRRAIRCYEKAGFQIIGNKIDKVNACVVMELKRPEKLI